MTFGAGRRLAVAPRLEGRTAAPDVAGDATSATASLMDCPDLEGRPRPPASAVSKVVPPLPAFSLEFDELLDNGLPSGMALDMATG